MARVQMVLKDGERARYIYHAKRDGKSLSAWLREAAQEKIDNQCTKRRLATPEDFDEFFRRCDEERMWHGQEPDWDDQKKLLLDSKLSGVSAT
ncbi:MAG: hypothetical protein OXF72_11895 [Gammaproteobacteria bacterium]|nr:hypothetical protein [Gammaproteobacteria bacterium]MCY4322527.1 hypothetical protein [Gammaproteobacteria bacterium]